MAELITKAKEILIGVWDSSGTTYPTTGDALDFVIADTLSVTQDDPTSQEFEFETTDTKEVFYTAGSYKVDLNNAELSEDFLTKIMGWVKIAAVAATESTTGSPEGFVAPKTYENRYVALQVKFSETCYFFIPRISIAPKLNMASVKTNLVYGTLSGTATNATVLGKQTSIGMFKGPIMTKTA